jgi:leader peptidase (prepilin peptidase)/N-methyltransferase
MAMSELLASNAVLYAAVMLFGSIVGSFLNVVIHRLPRRASLLTPPSHCPSCAARIRPWDNVPILSWLWLRARCRSCGFPIPWRYPLVELVTGIIAMLCIWRFGLSVEAARAFVLLASLVAVAFIDWEWMIIPDGISLGLLVLGLALSPFTGPGPLGALVGLLVGGGLLLLIGVLWQKLRGIEAMGGGDVKLMGAVGAFLGAGGALLVIFLGSFLGAVFGALLLRRDGQARIAFGTFLAVAAGVVVLVGDDLVGWYLSLLRRGL